MLFPQARRETMSLSASKQITQARGSCTGKLVDFSLSSRDLCSCSPAILIGILKCKVLVIAVIYFPDPPNYSGLAVVFAEDIGTASKQNPPGKIFFVPDK